MARPKKSADPEIAAIETIQKELAPLTISGKQRVMNYTWNRIMEQQESNPAPDPQVTVTGDPEA